MRKSIGIFDSGVGGLTMFRAIRSRFPKHSIFYVGDTARVPYGCRSPETICQYAEEIVSHLLTKPLSGIVVGCHSASSVAVPSLMRLLKEREIDIPLLDVLSYSVQEALELKQDGPVGVIGTEATIASGRYKSELKKYRPEIEVHSVACPLFVPLVEEGMTTGEITERVIEKYLSQLKGRVNALILGCTHYPLLKKAISDYLGNGVKMIDPAEVVALALTKQLPSENEGEGNSLFHVTDHPGRFHRIAMQILEEDIPYPAQISVSSPH